MIYELVYNAASWADDSYHRGEMNFLFEADSDEEAEELGQLEMQYENAILWPFTHKNQILSVDVKKGKLPTAKDLIAQVKMALGGIKLEP